MRTSLKGFAAPASAHSMVIWRWQESSLPFVRHNNFQIVTNSWIIRGVGKSVDTSCPKLFLYAISTCDGAKCASGCFSGGTISLCMTAITAKTDVGSRPAVFRGRERQMRLLEFRQSLTATEPPAGLTHALVGLWW